MCAMNADERPSQTPEGALLAEAQQQSPYSQREAAELAGMSENHWRAITKGYRTVSAGVYAPVRAPAATIARMARAVGVTPERLEEKGRTDAAGELRGLPPLDVAASSEPTTAELAEMVNTLQRQVQDLQARLRRMDDSGDQQRGAG